MSILLLTLAGLSLAIWIYLVWFRGRFWLCDQRLDMVAAPQSWPAVVAVVPARDEADVIERSMGSLLDQDYPGRFSIVLVDDGSSDGTGEIARKLAGTHPNGSRLHVLPGPPLPPGRAGKMWAVHNGTQHAAAIDRDATYFWLTDADIAHGPSVLRALATKAEREQRDLVSIMAMLHCRGIWEKLLIPAFVYFFQKLYPFPRVNDRADPMAGAAGGCMLVRRAALERAGGIAAIQSAVIDDCALARALKRNGPIWLGFNGGVRSIRAYDGLGDIWRMVARSAYDQLGYSPLALIGTVAGMALVYLAPPMLLLSYACHGSIAVAILAGAAWALMTWSYLPTLKMYRQPGWLAPLLPVAGCMYDLMTLDSALAYCRGRGAFWKGRAQAPRT